MKGGRKPRPLLLFYILVVYVLIQFGWWSYLLVRQNNELHQLRVELLDTKVKWGESEESSQSLHKAELVKRLHKEWMMVLGEGSVFLVLLVLGILRTRNSFKKETALNERQKNFILSVTHELRSPLASIRLQLETIRKHDLTKEKRDEMHTNAIEDIDRLNALIENILVAARLDNHAYLLRKEKADLSLSVRALVEKFQKVHAQDHVLTSDIVSDVWLSYDTIAFQSILVNLIENAIKYSESGTNVHVELKKSGENYSLRVTDHGKGISAAEKSQVFQRFYRIGNEETRNTKGTGLGLYIVKNLVEAHGWSIALRDRTGGGCVFEITIPIL